MTYQTYAPNSDLASVVKCYWTLEVAAEMDTPRQRVLPDGCIELFFILGDDVRRFVSDTEFIIQPRAMVLGQITRPFDIQPTGQVDTFAVRFYPYGFANFVDIPIAALADKETSLANLFGGDIAEKLSEQISGADNTLQRIRIIETFLLNRLREKPVIERILTSTVDALLSANGNISIARLMKNNLAQRRKLERAFVRQVGISPKQLGKVIRMQAVIRTLLSKQEDLIQIAYDNNYYDQAHFNKDFKEFTGINPGRFLGDKALVLSKILYAPA